MVFQEPCLVCKASCVALGVWAQSPAFPADCVPALGHMQPVPKCVRSLYSGDHLLTAPTQQDVEEAQGNLVGTTREHSWEMSL